MSLSREKLGPNRTPSMTMNLKHILLLCVTNLSLLLFDGPLYAAGSLPGMSPAPWTMEQKRAYEGAWLIFSGLRTRPVNNKEVDPATFFPLGLTLWKVQTPDGWDLCGWSAQRAGAQGTVLVVHGFMESSHTKNVVVEPAHYLWSEIGFAVAALDLRFHGQSGKGIPTFGPAEAWDIRTAVDHLEQLGYPKPFYLLGTSLGAMASAHAVFQDPRIEGAFLVMPPASSERAIKAGFPQVPSLVGKVLEWITPRVAKPEQFINDVYGVDLVKQGDLARLRPVAGHAPRILVVMASDDEYGFSSTLKAWEKWYPGESAAFNQSPATAPNQKKWMIERLPAENQGYWGHGLSPLWPDDNRRLLREFFHQAATTCVPSNQTESRSGQARMPGPMAGFSGDDSLPKTYD